MTEKEIQTIAQSIATTLDAPIDFVGEYELFLKELLRSFYLVEKSKVIAEYQQTKALFDEARKENALYVLAPMATSLQVLNLMYPEIEKEVEG